MDLKHNVVLFFFVIISLCSGGYNCKLLLAAVLKGNYIDKSEKC